MTLTHVADQDTLGGERISSGLWTHRGKLVIKSALELQAPAAPAGALASLVLPAGSLDGAALVDGSVASAKIATNAITRLATNYALGSDAWNNVGMAAADNGIAGVPSFPITWSSGTKYALFNLNANVQVYAPSAQTWCGFSLFQDGGSFARLPVVFSASPGPTGVRAGTLIYVPPAGTHTYEVRFYSSGATSNGFYLRAVTSPTTEFLTLQVIEFRQ